MLPEAYGFLPGITVAFFGNKKIGSNSLYVTLMVMCV